MNTLPLKPVTETEEAEHSNGVEVEQIEVIRTIETIKVIFESLRNGDFPTIAVQRSSLKSSGVPTPRRISRARRKPEEAALVIQKPSTTLFVVRSR